MQYCCKKDFLCSQMKIDRIDDILKSHQLRITETRREVLSYFLEQQHALSHKDLESNFKTYDRVTLYRTLNSFTEKGVLHRVGDDTGMVSYAVCFDTCAPKEHNHDHMHFKCDECGQLECLDQHIPELQVAGYQIREVNLVINGLCKSCYEKH